jgi:hypothetical protein
MKFFLGQIFHEIRSEILEIFLKFIVTSYSTCTKTYQLTRSVKDDNRDACNPQISKFKLT